MIDGRGLDEMTGIGGQIETLQQGGVVEGFSRHQVGLHQLGFILEEETNIIQMANG